MVASSHALDAIEGFQRTVTATSGRPYTPDNLPLSCAQNRDVHDLTRVNGLRSSAYARLDFRLEQAKKLGVGALTWHAELQNVLHRRNFYSYVWRREMEPEFWIRIRCRCFQTAV